MPRSVGKRRDRGATVRGDQGQALATVRGTKRELLGDHAAHRDTDDVGPVPPKVVQDPYRVVGHRGDRAKERPAVALPDAQDGRSGSSDGRLWSSST